MFFFFKVGVSRTGIGLKSCQATAGRTGVTHPSAGSAVSVDCQRRETEVLHSRLLFQDVEGGF